MIIIFLELFPSQIIKIEEKVFFRNKMVFYCDINNVIIFLLGENDNENNWNYKINLID